MHDLPNLEYRPGVEADAPAAAQVIKSALDDLLQRQGRPPTTPAGDEMTPVLRHLVACSPDRVWVAEADGRLVGFGAGLMRGDLRFLAGLFVAPEWQGRGVGGHLVRRAMAPVPIAQGLAAVLSSGANVVSNRLYAWCGMYPLMPALSLTGRVPLHEALPNLGTLDAAALSVSGVDVLRDVDTFVTGIDRTADHAWLLGTAKRRGWLFRRRGAVAGYVYHGGDGSEGPGYVGPLAARRAADVAAMLAFALGQMRPGEVATVMVPGANNAAQRLLSGFGFGLAGPTGLLGVSRPFGHFDRYVFAGNALM